MTNFDESKVINALHADKAEVGKKYWYADDIVTLKKYVENDSLNFDKLTTNDNECFIFDNSGCFKLIYPYEDSSAKRMTVHQLYEWWAKGNGIYAKIDWSIGLCNDNNTYICEKDFLNKKVDKDFVIRPFGTSEWIEPTVDIYERDCKGGKE